MHTLDNACPGKEQQHLTTKNAKGLGRLPFKFSGWSLLQLRALPRGIRSMPRPSGALSSPSLRCSIATHPHRGVRQHCSGATSGKALFIAAPLWWASSSCFEFFTMKWQILSIWALWDRSIFDEDALGLPNSPAVNFAIVSSLGYFVFDTLWCVARRDEDLTMFIHHFVCDVNTIIFCLYL